MRPSLTYTDPTARAEGSPPRVALQGERRVLGIGKGEKLIPELAE